MSIQKQIEDVRNATFVLSLKRQHIPNESTTHKDCLIGYDKAIDKLQIAVWQLEQCEKILKGMDLDTPIKEELKDITTYDEWLAKKGLKHG